MKYWSNKEVFYLSKVKKELHPLFSLQKIDTLQSVDKKTPIFMKHWRRYAEHTLIDRELTTFIHPFKSTPWYIKAHLNNSLVKLLL